MTFRLIEARRNENSIANNPAGNQIVVIIRRDLEKPRFRRTGFKPDAALPDQMQRDAPEPPDRRPDRPIHDARTPPLKSANVSLRAIDRNE